MWIYLLILTMFLKAQGSVSAVRLLELRVPAHAAEGGEAILGCEFDMEDDVLYSVKWYKDGREFYRYVPVSQHPISHFATTGVMVDVRRSSNTVVTLVHLARESSGLYRCEVSGEAPLFATVYDEKYITVYLLPETEPQLSGLKENYKIGERVSANCTSPSSRPEAQLKWLINNRLATKNYVRGPWYRTSARSDAVETILQLSFIVGIDHFKFDTINLKCQSTIAPLYQQESVHMAFRQEIQPLDSYTDEPIMTERLNPTFPNFGDTTLLLLDEEKSKLMHGSTAARHHLNTLVLLITYLLIIF